jgi:hypothetical protein
VNNTVNNEVNNTVNNEVNNMVNNDVNNTVNNMMNNSVNNVKSKILVLYVFHIYNDIVKEFINKCIFYDEYIDFIIISNNKKNIFNAPNYVKILFRDNIGTDFGGWSDGLLTNNLYKNYDKFIFINLYL